jgi:hypothetical protein
MQMDRIARYLNTGFGCVRLDDGGAMFELEFANGERIILRLSAAAVDSLENGQDDSENDEEFVSWMALVELEAENAYQCLHSEARRGFIYDIG